MCAMACRRLTRCLLVVLLGLVALTVVSGPVAASDGGEHLGNDTHVVCPASDHGHTDADERGHDHAATTSTTAGTTGGGDHGGGADGGQADEGTDPLNDPANCEFTDVQRAVNQSTDGDLVYLQPGTYYQAVTISRPANLTLAGAGRDRTFLVTPNADHHDRTGNETGSGDDYTSNNPFADPDGYVQDVVAYPGQWAEEHANDPAGKAQTHANQAEEEAGVDVVPEQDDHEHVTYDAVYVTADNVTVRDLEVRGFGGNGVYYRGVVDFHVTRVDAIDNGGYGIYAIRSTLGVFEDSYAEGHYDSGFYLGESSRCECIVRNVTAAENLLGYSGTGAGYIHIVNSTWRDNAAGIVPNILPQEPEYQSNLEIRNNRVVNNNNRTAFRNWHFAGSLHAPVGTGVVVGGGSFNTVRDNEIRNHSWSGVLITYMFTEPVGNAVVENEFAANDLDVWWDGGGANNCFSNNRVANGSLTFDAGTYWNTQGSLPDCDGSESASAPAPEQLSQVGTLVVYGCYPSELPAGERCHVEEPEPHYHPPATPQLPALETRYGAAAVEQLRERDT